MFNLQEKPSAVQGVHAVKIAATLVQLAAVMSNASNMVTVALTFKK